MLESRQSLEQGQRLTECQDVADVIGMCIC